MNKRVITSVRPKECELIASGKQTMLVRKTRPKIETPFKCYIYMTATKECCRLWEYITAYQNSKGEILNGSQKVIGGFICDRIEEFHEWQLSPSGKFQEYEQRDLDRFLKESCISFEDVCEYRRNMPYYKPLYGWHISDLKIYDKPKELGEFFRKPCNHINDCCTCKEAEFQYDGDELRGLICKREISLTRPPQSWVYCEPIEEE